MLTSLQSKDMQTNKLMWITLMDESWVNTGTSAEGFERQDIENTTGSFLAGLSTGLKSSVARGPRCVLVHNGNESGFVLNSEIIFLCKMNTADEHVRRDGEIMNQTSGNNFPQIYLQTR
jgi:hypothetical protein